MDERKEKILKIVVEDFIKDRRSISSCYIEKNYNLGIGAATIRNEMARLMKEGYLVQPHISGGRIPTQRGYQYFIENLCKFSISQALEKKLQEILKQSLQRKSYVSLLEFLSETTSNLAVLRLKELCFLEGLDELFSLSDFQEKKEMILAMEFIEGLLTSDCLFQIRGDSIQIYIGEDIPELGEHSKNFSFICSPWAESGFLGIFGPIRMDYSKNISILEKIRDLILEQGLVENNI